MSRSSCTFCAIIAGRLPSSVRYRDDEVVAFDNKLRWFPVMLLVVPRQHMGQAELWGNGPLMAKVAALAVGLGQQYCPNGFRILSNFGHDALQTQPHAHVHVIGGTHLGLYAQPAWPDF